MATFGPLEAARMALVRPELTSKVLQLMNAFELRTGGKKLYVSDGYRSDAYQAVIYADSLRPDGTQAYRVSPPGKSRHAKGGATDLHVVGHEDQADPLYDVLGQEAEALGLVWGGRFKGRLPDRFHVELRETDAQAAERWTAFSKEVLQSAGIGGALLVVAVLALYFYSRRGR